MEGESGRSEGSKMSKLPRQMVACESCARDIEMSSPPLRKYYERGRIEIVKYSTVLLNRPPTANSHSVDISGYYCDLNCLITRVKDLRAEIL